MPSWRFTAVRVTIVAMSSMAQYDCDPLSEPATKLEHCIERAVNQMKRPGEVAHVSCDLKLQGRFTVVLHPAVEVNNEDLVSAGLPDALVPELRAMRSRRGPAIYVISSDPSVKGTGAHRTIQSSRTTTQSTFVEINDLMVVTRNTQPLTVEVGRNGMTAMIRRIR